MIRGFIFFLFVWIAVSVGISLWRGLTGKEKWDIIKCVSYGAITAIIASVFIVSIVVLF